MNKRTKVITQRVYGEVDKPRAGKYVGRCGECNLILASFDKVKDSASKYACPRCDGITKLEVI